MILGDLNINFINSALSGDLDVLDDNLGLFDCMFEPTRIFFNSVTQTRTATKIDDVLSSKPDSYTALQPVDSGISDHRFCFRISK